jgi:hypothetical protein
MSHETIFTNAHVATNETVTLDACPGTNLHVGLYLSEWSHEYILVQVATIEIHGLNDLDARGLVYIFEHAVPIFYADIYLRQGNQF